MMNSFVRGAVVASESCSACSKRRKKQRRTTEILSCAQNDELGGLQLDDGASGGLGSAAVGGALEEQAAGTELSVGGELVLDVSDGTGLAVAAEQLDRAETVLAAEFGVFVHQGDGDVFNLPIGLVPSSSLETAAAYLALVHLFPFDCH
jgi:hypothetical protein